MSTDASQLHTNATSLETASQGSSATHDDALKQKAGKNDTTLGTLRYLARLLYEAANELKIAVNTGDGNAASNLATEVGASESDGLRQPLAALADARDADLTQKAQAVKEKYDDVKSKFEAVQKQKDKYTKNKGQEQYPLVVEAWNAFNTKYNYVKFDKHAIDGGHERRQYSDAPKYDVQGQNLGSGFKLKAEELETAAKALQDKAEGDSVLSTLKDNAQQLATEAEKLATSSSGEASTHGDKVITKYNDLETEYNKLESKPAEKAKVKKEFETVKHIYDRMLNVTKANTLKTQATTIKNQAGTLYEKAHTLAGASGVSDQPDLTGPLNALKTAVGASVASGLQKALNDLSTANVGNLRDLITKAQDVINKYNAVDKAYEKVKAQATQYRSALGGGDEKPYTDVVSKFGQLKGAYNLGKCKAITPIFDKPWIR